MGSENRKKVLIIDDEKDFCESVRANLQEMGDFEVQIANDPQQGLRMARSIQPAVILLDILMPGMDGFQVLKKLKEDQQTLAIPVLMLSALTDVESKKRASTLYDEDYVEKPVQMPALKSKIEAILSRIGL